MKLTGLTLSGVTRYSRPVSLDLAALGPGLIAVTGPNGAGKTTLLEATGPLPLYRELPTRPDQPWHLPTGGRVELVFQLGAEEVSARLAVAAKGTATATLTRPGWASSGKLRDFDLAVAELLGPSQAFYASVFGAQGGRGRFASLSVSDRRALLRFYLGLDRLDRLATEARAKAAALDGARAQRLTAEQSRLLASDLPLAESAVEVAQAEALRAQEALLVAEAAHLDGERHRGLASLMAAYRRDLLAVVEAERALEALPPAVDGAPDVEAAMACLSASTEASDALRAHNEQVRSLTADLDALRARQAAEENLACLASGVPCKGEGLFGSCPLLADATAASARAATIAERAAIVTARLADAREMRDSAPLFDLAGARAMVVEANAAASAASRRASATERLNAARARALATRRGLPKALGDIPQPSDLDRLQAEVQAAKRRAAEAEASKGRKEAELAGLRGRIADLGAELATELARIADGPAWALLGRALGPTGIQALEVDAAGPEIADLANALLEACYGDRFEVEVATQRALRSREGSAEDLTIRVTDRERGRAGSVDTLSGGEQVIVDEALRTALALFSASRRGGARVETLWRDETPAALYGDNVSRYVTMLHRARTLGGFHQVLFVGGQASADLADAWIRVDAAGTLTSGR